MASVKIELVNQNKKPTISYDTVIGDITILVDTGANIPIYFGSLESFLLIFPDAKETNWITFVSGLGGTNSTPCSIYNLPKFSLIDADDNQKAFSIINMPVAIYDTGEFFGYHIIMSYTAFSKVDVSFHNRPNIPYMQIDYDRDVASTIEAYKNHKGVVYEIDGKVVVDYMRTFFQASGYDIISDTKGCDRN